MNIRHKFMGTTGNISLSSLRLARGKNYSNISYKEIKVQSHSFSLIIFDFYPQPLEQSTGMEWILFDASIIPFMKTKCGLAITQEYTTVEQHASQNSVLTFSRHTNTGSSRCFEILIQLAKSHFVRPTLVATVATKIRTFLPILSTSTRSN